MKFRLASGLGIATLVGGAALLAGCSGGVSPLALDDAAHSAQAVMAASLRDSSSGCIPVQPTNTSPGGYNCVALGSTSTFTVPAGVNITQMTVSLAGGQGGNADP